MDECPKCGAAKTNTLVIGVHEWAVFSPVHYACGTTDHNGDLDQSDACRIAELEAENARLREAFDLLAYHKIQIEYGNRVNGKLTDWRAWRMKQDAEGRNICRSSTIVGPFPTPLEAVLAAVEEAGDAN